MSLTNAEKRSVLADAIERISKRINNYSCHAIEDAFYTTHGYSFLDDPKRQAFDAMLRDYEVFCLDEAGKPPEWWESESRWTEVRVAALTAFRDSIPDLHPCRSPYCECTAGQCTHPGFYDARGTTP